MVIWRDFPFVVHFLAWSYDDPWGATKRLRIHEFNPDFDLSKPSVFRRRFGTEAKLENLGNSSCTDFGIGRRMLSFTCDSDHVSFFTSPTTKKSNLQKNPEGFLTSSFVATLARSSSTLPVGFSFLHVVGRFKWSVRWDFTQFVEFGPWQVSQHRTLGARRHFFLDGRGWCCYRWIFVDFVLEHNGKKGRWTELRMEMWLVDISGAICLEQSTPSLIELSIRMFSWISNWKACYYGNHQN